MASFLIDRKSTRLNSSHGYISYAVFCLKKKKKFTVGQYIFKEGEPGNRLFIIAEGEVRISRPIPGSVEEALPWLKPGPNSGEMAIFDRSERATYAIAKISCTRITISRSDFELLLDCNRDIAYKVLWSVVRLLSSLLFFF